jgi:hypothetical protein
LPRTVCRALSCYLEPFLGENCRFEARNSLIHYFKKPRKFEPLSTDKPEKLSPFSDPDSGSGLVLNVSTMATPDCWCHRHASSCTTGVRFKALSNEVPHPVNQRGLPRQVKGAGLRTLSRRGSWVQIPPPAPLYGPARSDYPRQPVCMMQIQDFESGSTSLGSPKSSLWMEEFAVAGQFAKDAFSSVVAS